MGGCQNYGPFFGSRIEYGIYYYLRYPTRDPNFDNYPYEHNGKEVQVQFLDGATNAPTRTTPKLREDVENRTRIR